MLFLRTVASHESAVNCVRFSPGGMAPAFMLHMNDRAAPVAGRPKQLTPQQRAPTWTMGAGSLLATGGDKGELHLWRQEPANAHGNSSTNWKRHFLLRCLEPSRCRCVATGVPRCSSFTCQAASLFWISCELHAGGRHVLNGSACRGHLDDVQDLAWAPDDSGLISGSVENTCIVWDAETGKGNVQLQGHEHYVQGVAWDPTGQLLVSLSSDRTGRQAYLHRQLPDCFTALQECSSRRRSGQSVLHACGRLCHAILQCMGIGPSADCATSLLAPSLCASESIISSRWPDRVAISHTLYNSAVSLPQHAMQCPAGCTGQGRARIILPAQRSLL